MVFKLGRQPYSFIVIIIIVIIIIIIIIVITHRRLPPICAVASRSVRRRLGRLRLRGQAGLSTSGARNCLRQSHG
jgi:hypothetical protein